LDQVSPAIVIPFRMKPPSTVSFMSSLRPFDVLFPRLILHLLLHHPLSLRFSGVKRLRPCACLRGPPTESSFPFFPPRTVLFISTLSYPFFSRYTSPQGSGCNFSLPMHTFFPSPHRPRRSEERDPRPRFDVLSCSVDAIFSFTSPSPHRPAPDKVSKCGLLLTIFF